MCNCTKGKKSENYVVTHPDGTKVSYSSEVAASVAAKKTGGTYRKVS